MCCIFTCCGWMIDLIQRVWVFLMSCCIFSGVCCVLLTTSMSGVALGYNYSLAEYIDLKETNVSVFIKRGVFDDEVVNEMIDFRRKGQSEKDSPKSGNSRVANEEVGPEEIPDVRSGGRRQAEPEEERRSLDDTIVQSEDNHNFEGGLMKLTLIPPYSTTVSTMSPTPDLANAMIPVMATNVPNSLDQLKAIQGLINARKAMAARNPLDTVAVPHDQPRKTLNKNSDGNEYNPNNAPNREAIHRRMMETFPEAGIAQARRNMMMAANPNVDQNLANVPNINPARLAVPDRIEKVDWVVPKLDPETYNRLVEFGLDVPDKMAKPVTYRSGPIRPPTADKEELALENERRYFHFTTIASHKRPPSVRPSPYKGEDVNILDDKASGNEGKIDAGSGSDADKNKDDLEKTSGPKIVGPENNDYYDEELKGLPVRKRRSINNNKAKLHFAKVEKAMAQKVNPHLTKFKVGKSISNEITDYPSVLVSKLHFLDNALSNETTSTNEKEVRNGSKTVGLTVNDSHPIKDSTIGKVLKIIHSMFS